MSSVLQEFRGEVSPHDAATTTGDDTPTRSGALETPSADVVNTVIYRLVDSEQWQKRFWKIRHHGTPMVFSYEAPEEQIGTPVDATASSIPRPSLWQARDDDEGLADGILALMPERPALFTKRFNVCPQDLPRWEPQITSNQIITADDDE